MNKRIHAKCLLAFWMVLGIVIWWFYGKVTHDAAKPVPSGADMSIEAELSQAQEVLDCFYTKETFPTVELVNRREQAVNYIPAGADCMDVSALGEVVYIDYRLNGIRYLVSYYRDGTVEKIASQIPEGGI